MVLNQDYLYTNPLDFAFFLRDQPNLNDIKKWKE